jgi:hypothetical protein
MHAPQRPEPLDAVNRGAALSDHFAAAVDALLEASAPPLVRQRLQRLIAILAAQVRRDAQPSDLAAFRRWADAVGPEETRAFVLVLAASAVRVALAMSDEYAGTPIPPPLGESGAR